MFTHIPLFVRVLPFYAFTALCILVPIVRDNIRTADALATQTMLEQRLVQPVAEEIRGSDPMTLTIPTLGINVSVVSGTVQDATRTWNVADGKANYATGTALPNNADEGKTFIYGHRTPEVFAKLHTLAMGAPVYVTTSDGKVFKYRAISTEVVKPTDLSVLQDLRAGDGLMLMTCTGPWDSERYIVLLDLVEATR